MKASYFVRYAQAGCVAAAMLTGCGGSQPPIGAPGAMQPTSSLQTSRIKTWISPHANDAQRLFFQGAGDNIYIFSLPEMTLKGTITGLSEPLGMCSDLAGNIYVAESGKSRVDEFTRTGTLLATYTDTYGNPVACAVNPQDDRLAIVDTNSPLKVLVFGNPSSPPTILTVPDMTELTFAGYNDKGELWVDGYNGVDFGLSRCNASKCKPLIVQGAQGFAPGTVQWDDVRKTWVIFDQSCDGYNPCSQSCPVSEQGVLGNCTGYNNYDGFNVCSLKQAVIGADRKGFVVGGDWGRPCDDKNAVYRYAYPAGGSPTNYGFIPKELRPYGAALSTK